MIPFLVAMMLLTGVCNTLLSKYQVCSPLPEHVSGKVLKLTLFCLQDLQCVRNCDSGDPDKVERFSQPVIQT